MHRCNPEPVLHCSTTAGAWSHPTAPQHRAGSSSHRRGGNPACFPQEHCDHGVPLRRPLGVLRAQRLRSFVFIFFNVGLLLALGIYSPVFCIPRGDLGRPLKNVLFFLILSKKKKSFKNQTKPNPLLGAGDEERGGEAAQSWGQDECCPSPPALCRGFHGSAQPSKRSSVGSTFLLGGAEEYNTTTLPGKPVRKVQK